MLAALGVVLWMDLQDEGCKLQLELGVVQTAARVRCGAGAGLERKADLLAAQGRWLLQRRRLVLAA